VSVAEQTTLASIGDGATIVALGQGPGLAVTNGFQGNFSSYGSQSLSVEPTSPTTGSQSGDLDPTTVSQSQTEAGWLLGLDRTTAPIQQTVHGVIVNATARSLMRSIAASGAGAGNAAITL